MEFNFSVDRSKKIKRVNNMGEDAPPVSKSGVLIVCDGTGATGQSKHEYNGAEYTSAYLGARITSKSVEEFISDKYEEITAAVKYPEVLKALMSALGNKIRKDLLSFVEENHLQLTVRGKSFKLLPTTLAAAIYKVYDNYIDIIALSAGDSRVLLWESENGLQQLSVDDVESGYDAFSDVSNTNNCISADQDFKINYLVHTLPLSKCVLFATSDGFTDPIKPFDQERYLIQWLGNCDCVLDAENSKLADYIGDSFDTAGFTGKDDCSIAGTIIGYTSDAELKDSFRNRFDYVANTFSIPYRKLGIKCREALDEYNRTNVEQRKYVDQIREKIEKRLMECASMLLPISYDKNQYVYDFLNSNHFIVAENQQMDNEIEIRMQKVNEQFEKAKKSVDEAFVKFLKDYSIIAARNGIDTGLPPGIIHHLEICENAELNKKITFDAYNQALRRIKQLSEVNSYYDACPGVEGIASLCDELVRAVTEIDKFNRAVVESDRIVSAFFSPEEPRIEKMFEEHVRNNFAYFEKGIESLKPSRGWFGGKIGKSRDDELGYNQLRRRKDELDRAISQVTSIQNEKSYVKIRDEERLQRYEAVIKKSINELFNLVMENPRVFSFLADEEKTVYDARLVSYAQVADNAKELIRLKNELWKKYKPSYELFAVVEKDCVFVPKNCEGNL